VDSTCSLTELSGTQFLVRAGSETRRNLLSQIQTIPATPEKIQEEDAAIEGAVTRQVRYVDKFQAREALQKNFESPLWEVIASRCLACANCTMVCPTCFCTTIEDFSDLSGNYAERLRCWDSCFTLNFSYIHGGSVRASARARYRQWLTHKFASWIDQYGMLGCVGCGRCITWCPVGIDLTKEIRRFQEVEDHGIS